ncbi:MAG: hypothetical protein IT233_09525 [Bacteroidia bacterium]|nr:hypothetical protein [Bacteroidia bacterium]
MQPNSREVISLEKAIVRLSPEGHVHIRLKEHHHLELEDMKAMHEAKLRLVGDQPYTLIFESGEYNNISKEGREFSATIEVNRNAIAKAIVTNSLATRMISNFFIKINRPPAPTYLFRTFAEASEWLQKKREEYFALQGR